jgi:hypothetical protein
MLRIKFPITKVLDGLRNMLEQTIILILKVSYSLAIQRAYSKLSPVN